MTRKTFSSEARPNRFQNYTREQCRQSWSDRASKKASALRISATASSEPSDSFRYLLFRLQYPTTLLINPVRRRGYGPKLYRYMYETKLHVPVTGCFAILSIIPSSCRKKNTRFCVFRKCNMDFPSCTAKLGLKLFLLHIWNERILNCAYRSIVNWFLCACNYYKHARVL